MASRGKVVMQARDRAVVFAAAARSRRLRYDLYWNACGTHSVPDSHGRGLAQRGLGPLPWCV
jgi:hypothetical protein